MFILDHAGEVSSLVIAGFRDGTLSAYASSGTSIDAGNHVIAVGHRVLKHLFFGSGWAIAAPARHSPLSSILRNEDQQVSTGARQSKLSIRDLVCLGTAQSREECLLLVHCSIGGYASHQRRLDLSDFDTVTVDLIGSTKAIAAR
jgi:hypothetical protein